MILYLFKILLHTYKIVKLQGARTTFQEKNMLIFGTTGTLALIIHHLLTQASGSRCLVGQTHFEVRSSSLKLSALTMTASLVNSLTPP